MKFDTRDKKPKLFNILILTILTSVIIAGLLLAGFEKTETAIWIVSTIYYFIVLLMLIFAFIGQLQYNPYSYNTIFYAGFVFFLISIILTHIAVMVRRFQYPDLYPVQNIFFYLLSSAKTYMFFSFPFILLFSIALCVSNISLIRNEGLRLVNLLGILLSFLMLGGEIFLFVVDFYVSGSLEEVRFHELMTNLFAAIYLYVECMLIGVIVANIIVVHHKPEPDKDFLIILGCGIRKDGTPTPLLRGRIDRAIAFARDQKEKTGKDLLFITSGGKGPDEVISESACMKQYMLTQGIPESQIVEEDQSTSTFENMQFSKEKIRAINPEGKVAFSTTNYHVFRSGLYARRVKMRAIGMGAKTKWYFWPNAAVREFVGLLTAHKVKQIIILGCMIVFYVTLTMLVYSRWM